MTESHLTLYVSLLGLLHIYIYMMEQWSEKTDRFRNSKIPELEGAKMKTHGGAKASKEK